MAPVDARSILGRGRAVRLVGWKLDADCLSRRTGPVALYNRPMSYQVLARKWRPRSFAELVGQPHVVRALSNALDGERLHHAFLFTGTRGVGKTTVARILAKCLNCETGATARPCGECGACLELDEGRFVDLIEVDAASRARVDETRELLDNVQYVPARGRYKVYLIDEVHMFSKHSFNALLKTLEEPPPHVKFLLATTDPQRLPITVLSRCLQFNLRRLPVDLIDEQLARITRAEMVPFEPGAMRLLARGADGSMRDALSLLDQAISFGGGKVDEADARSMLGTIERTHIAGLLEALATQDPRAMFAAIEILAQTVPDFEDVLGEFASALTRLAVLQVVLNPPRDDLEDDVYKPFVARIVPELVQLYYQIALIGRRDLPLAPSPRSGFEMVMLRMLSFSPDGLGSTLPGAKLGGDSPVPAPTEASPGTGVPATPGAASSSSIGRSAPPAFESAGELPSQRAADGAFTAGPPPASGAVAEGAPSARAKAQVSGRTQSVLSPALVPGPNTVSPSLGPPTPQQLTEPSGGRDPNIAACRAQPRARGQTLPVAPAAEIDAQPRGGPDSRAAVAPGVARAPNPLNPVVPPETVMPLGQAAAATSGGLNPDGSIQALPDGLEVGGAPANVKPPPGVIVAADMGHGGPDSWHREKQPFDPILPPVRASKPQPATEAGWTAEDEERWANPEPVPESVAAAPPRPVDRSDPRVPLGPKQRALVTDPGAASPTEHADGDGAAVDLQKGLGRAMPADWAAIVGELDLSGVSRELALNTALVEISEGRVALALAPNQSALLVEGMVRKFEAALVEYMGHALRVDIRVVDHGFETPASIRDGDRAAELQAARMAIEADPNVQALCERFGARVDMGSVRPR